MTTFYSKYPLIYKDITRLWGTSEGRAYLVVLLKRAKTYNPTKINYSGDDIKFINELLEKHDGAYPELDDTYEYIKETFTSSNRPPIQKELYSKKEESHFLTRIILLAVAALCAIFLAKHFNIG